jgi:hypothetical protein
MPSAPKAELVVMLSADAGKIMPELEGLSITDTPVLKCEPVVRVLEFEGMSVRHMSASVTTWRALRAMSS